MERKPSSFSSLEAEGGRGDPLLVHPWVQTTSLSTAPSFDTPFLLNESTHTSRRKRKVIFVQRLIKTCLRLHDLIACFWGGKGGVGCLKIGHGAQRDVSAEQRLEQTLPPLHRQ